MAAPRSIVPVAVGVLGLFVGPMLAPACARPCACRSVTAPPASEKPAAEERNQSEAPAGGAGGAASEERAANEAFERRFAEAASEPRDDAWAGATEQAVLARFDPIGEASLDQIRCGSRSCVAVISTSGPTAAIRVLHALNELEPVTPEELDQRGGTSRAILLRVEPLSAPATPLPAEPCEACLVAAERGDTPSAARAFKACQDEPRRNECTRRVKRNAPAAAEAAAKEGRCGQAQAIVRGARLMGGGSMTLQRVARRGPCG